jgi:hypothetical protein
MEHGRTVAAFSFRVPEPITVGQGHWVVNVTASTRPRLATTTHIPVAKSCASVPPWTLLVRLFIATTNRINADTGKQW